MRGTSPSDWKSTYLRLMGMRMDEDMQISLFVFRMLHESHQNSANSAFYILTKYV